MKGTILSSYSCDVRNPFLLLKLLHIPSTPVCPTFPRPLVRLVTLLKKLSPELPKKSIELETVTSKAVMTEATKITKAPRTMLKSKVASPL